jgi:hypothetical protein
VRHAVGFAIELAVRDRSVPIAVGQPIRVLRGECPKSFGQRGRWSGCRVRCRWTERCCRLRQTCPSGLAVRARYRGRNAAVSPISRVPRTASGHSLRSAGDHHHPAAP